MKVAGIDVHKNVLMVVVVDASTPDEKPRRVFVDAVSRHRYKIIALTSGEAASPAAGSVACGAEVGLSEGDTHEISAIGGDGWREPCGGVGG